jgi:hypothetical protein
MKLVFSRQILEKYSNIIFLQNPSSGSRVIPCGQTDTWTDILKLIVAFAILRLLLKARKEDGAVKREK